MGLSEPVFQKSPTFFAENRIEKEKEKAPGSCVGIEVDQTKIPGGCFHD